VNQPTFYLNQRRITVKNRCATNKSYAKIFVLECWCGRYRGPNYQAHSL